MSTVHHSWWPALGRHRLASRRALRPRVEALETTSRVDDVCRRASSKLPWFRDWSRARPWNSRRTAGCSSSSRAATVKLVHTDGTTWTALHLNVDSQGERGLLGIAFDPNFNTDKFVYLYYTNPNPGGAAWATGEHNQLSRFTVNDSNPQQPQFVNEAPILDWNTLSIFTNHNGGAIHFGVDGMLYADAGDNLQTFTQGGNTYRVSQTLANLLGKQLRINVSAFNIGVATRDDTAVGHLIPSNNPFVGTASGINQLIYALGLRNPYTFAVLAGDRDDLHQRRG